MPIEGTQLHDDGNWTLMYVLLGVTPAIFAAVAIYSVWRDRAIRRGNDIEMEAGQTFRRPRRFPWKEAIAVSEQPGASTAAGPSYTKPLGGTGTKPPIPSTNFSRPSGSSSNQRTGERRRDRTTAQAHTAGPGPRVYEYGKKEPSGSKSKYSKDFQEIPL